MLNDRPLRVILTTGILLAAIYLAFATGPLVLGGGQAVQAAPLAQVADTDTPTFTPSRAPTFTPGAPVHVVISEFRTRGPVRSGDPNGDRNEFIELFNPSGAAVNIGGWTIRKSSGCGTTLSTLVAITSGVILQPGGHYLVAASGVSLSVSPNQYISSSSSYAIPDDGGLALVETNGNIVDAVGMCISTLYREGTPLLPMSGISDHSYARNPIGTNSGCYDVNNNVADFTLISPPAPQNKNSSLAMCQGVMTSTPTHTPTKTPTRTPTRTITPIPGFVVLNEILPHPRTDWNEDNAANVDDEYIEIINLGVLEVNMKGWRMDNGEDGENSYALPEMVLEPRAIARIFRSESGVALSDAGATVRLLKPAGQIADAFTYDVVEAADISWCRLPDGGAYWTFACRPTPGRPNSRAGSTFLTPTPTRGPGAALAPGACPLADTVPAGVIQAECGQSPATIWNWNWWGKIGIFWLESRFKWEVFIQ